MLRCRLVKRIPSLDGLRAISISLVVVGHLTKAGPVPKFLANYAYINLTDPILRSPGIGNVQVFGAGQYAMRLWVTAEESLTKQGIASRLTPAR